MKGLLILILALTAVAGHPHGAPASACDTMYPLHKHSPQTTPCPFETQPYQVFIS